MKKVIKWFFITIGCLVGLIILLGIIGSFMDSETSTQQDNNEANTEATTVDTSFITRLNREIVSIDSNKVNWDEYKSNADLIKIELALFESWSSMVNRGLNSSNVEEQKAAKILMDKLIPLQKKEFPLLRKNWAEILKNKVWENNIYVTQTNSKTINITGALFANNKNIKDTQAQLNEMVTALRFKQVRYRWYKDAEEYTYYDIKSKGDNEI